MEYDLQIAITQQTLNSQLAQMWDDGQIPTVFDLSGDDDNPTVAMGAPRITILDPLPNSTGSCPLVVNITFPIFSQRPDKCEVLDTLTNETVDLEGHFFKLETSLECVTAAIDFNNVALSDGTKKSLTDFYDASPNFNLATKILRPDFSQGLDVNGAPQFEPPMITDPEGAVCEGVQYFAAMILASINALAINPYSMMVYMEQVDFNQSVQPQSLIPTSSVFASSINADPDFNQLIILSMTNGHQIPASADGLLGHLSNPRVTDASAQGYMQIRGPQFGSTYIYSSVATTLKHSIMPDVFPGEPIVSTITSPSSADGKLHKGGSDFFIHGYQDNKDCGPDGSRGHGPKVGDSGAHAIYAVTKYDNSINLPSIGDPNTSTNASNDSIIFAGNGQYSNTVTTYRKGAGHDYDATGQTVARQPFDLTITLRATTSGAISSVIDIVPGPVQPPTHWETDDFYVGHSNTEDYISDQGPTVAQLVNDDFSAFAGDDINAFADVQDGIVLPDGALYQFRDLTLDDENNVCVSLTVR